MQIMTDAQAMIQAINQAAIETTKEVLQALAVA